MLWAALSLSLGYNATLVTLGASLLGAAAGMAGTFPYLKKMPLLVTQFPMQHYLGWVSPFWWRLVLE